MASDFLVGGERGVVTVVAAPIDGRHLLSGLELPQRVQQLWVGSRTYTCTVNERVDIVGGCSRCIHTRQSLLLTRRLFSSFSLSL